MFQFNFTYLWGVADLVREDVEQESAESNLNLINGSWKTKLEERYQRWRWRLKMVRFEGKPKLFCHPLIGQLWEICRTLFFLILQISCKTLYSPDSFL